MRRLLGIFLFAFTITAAAASAETVRFGIWRQFDTLDPIYDTTVGQSIIDAAVFETLVIGGPDSPIEPGQAESWTISEDGLTYTFNLRDGITWSDGTPVTAGDFVAGFQRLVDPANSLLSKPLYLVGQIKNANEVIEGALPASELGIRAVDDETLEITLISPASYFLSILAYPALAPAPRHVIAEHGNDWWKQRPLVSNGQLVLVETDQERYIMRRRDEHWDPLAYEELTVDAFENNALVFQSLVRGNLDIALGIPNKQTEYTERGYAGRVDRLIATGTYYGVFNTLDPKLADPNVRRALSMIVDRKAIADSLGLTDASVGKTFTTPMLLTPSPDNLPEWLDWPMDQRIEEARRLLAEAGYTDDSPLELTIAAGTHNDYDKIATGVRSMWSQAPVKAEMQSVSPTELSKVLRDKTYQFAIAGWYSDYSDPLTFLTLFQKGGQINNSAWSGDDYTVLLNQALAEPDLAARTVLYNQMEKILADQAPVFAIIYPELRIGVAERVKSYVVHGSIIPPRGVVLQTD